MIRKVFVSLLALLLIATLVLWVWSYLGEAALAYDGPNCVMAVVPDNGVIEIQTLLWYRTTHLDKGKVWPAFSQRHRPVHQLGRYHLKCPMGFFRIPRGGVFLCGGPFPTAYPVFFYGPGLPRREAWGAFALRGPAPTRIRFPLWCPFAILLALLAYRPTHTLARASVRRRKGLCPKCGYNLTGNVSGVCPECGEKI